MKHRPYLEQFYPSTWGAVLLACGWSPVHRLDKATIRWMQDYAARYWP